MDSTDIRLKYLGDLLLRTGSLLMSNGASTARIRMTVDRIANTFGYEANLFITHRALNLTLSDLDHEHSFSSIKRTSPHGVNFKIVSGISRLSWRIKEENLSLETLDSELERISKLSHYPRLVTLALVALAGASFCGIFGGSIQAMGVGYLATFVGLFVRQEAHKNKFNSYLCVFFASLTSTLISGLFCYLFPKGGFESAYATSVLYLIPGVPLINSFTDMIDGNILNGILRAVHGLIISFMIALGLITTIGLYHL